ncbi:replication associated protein [Simismacovirus malbas1]|uniref:Replication associated protein n=1 Tax=Chlorocebus cynosuros associated smacovirus TaxID=2213167 RepID=A0A455R557_9VIRU|nr:replication associated protein [Chlorocebus cynosuros associated smacovirus]BBE29368.1 replication associated protein [Chlorocebus cynosuros associated smacovirus]
MITIDYILTIPRHSNPIKMVRCVLASVDAKKAIIGRELGQGGLDHWQVVVRCSGDLPERIMDWTLGWHVEECRDFTAGWDYCRKEGRYQIYKANHADIELERIRRYKYNTWQNRIYNSIKNQNDRVVTVWIDVRGGHGKTVLWLNMVGRGEVLPVPRSKLKAGRLSAWVCDAWDGHEIIWIDLPRNRKLDPDLCGELEELKDGVAFDDRYGAHWKIIRGTKILVTTNQWIDNNTYKSLSEDRWDIHIIQDEDEDGSELPR